MKTVRTIEQIIEDKKILGWPDERIAEHLAQLTGGAVNNNTLVIPIRKPAARLPIAA